MRLSSLSICERIAAGVSGAASAADFLCQVVQVVNGSNESGSCSVVTVTDCFGVAPLLAGARAEETSRSRAEG